MVLQLHIRGIDGIYQPTVYNCTQKIYGTGIVEYHGISIYQLTLKHLKHLK